MKARMLPLSTGVVLRVLPAIAERIELLDGDVTDGTVIDGDTTAVAAVKGGKPA